MNIRGKFVGMRKPEQHFTPHITVQQQPRSALCVEESSS